MGHVVESDCRVLSEHGCQIDARTCRAWADTSDNALMECFVGLFKTECIRTTVFHAGPYRNVADVEWVTACSVDWYNNWRLHSSLDYLTPKEFDHAHYAALNREPQSV